jgi:RimJ/RimL family protein N-acetyltransferase
MFASLHRRVPSRQILQLIIQELDNHSLPRLREYLERDPTPNIYALSGLFSKGAGSEFYIASNTIGDKIEGALVIRRGYKRPFAWLVTDSNESTEELSKLLNFENASIWVKPQYEDILEETISRIPSKIDSKERFDIMELDRTNTKLNIKYPWRRLSERDAYAWAKTEALAEQEEVVDKKGKNENVEPSEERIRSSERLLRTFSCFGIFDAEEKSILARSAIEELESATAIRRVFTNPALRNQGYGRSITSVAVQEAMKNRDSKRIVLFVLQNNHAAKQIYETMGFRRVASRTEFELIPKAKF